MGGRLSASAAWNLSLNVFGASQTLALLVAGSIIDGLAGVGVIVTAMAAALLGHALADFGLASELGRLSLAYPSRATVDRCTRAIVRQAPLALVLGPAVYLILGPTTASVPLLAVIGLNGSLLVATVGLTAVLQGLGDFRSPAARLGSARLISSFAAVAAAVVEPTPTVVLGSFAIAECVGVVALAGSVRRARLRLPVADHPDGAVRRSHVWLGVAFLINMLTHQGDTILVASILSPDALGLFATASALQNGVTTLSSSLGAPVGLRSISATLRGDPRGGARRLRQALVITAGSAAILAILTWLVARLAGESVDELSELAAGQGPVVLALCLAAGPLGGAGNVCLLVGIGFARHRRVGACQIQAGLVAVVAIVAGAQLAGVVGAAAGTVVRDIVRLALARRLTKPPTNSAAPPADPMWKPG